MSGQIIKVHFRLHRRLHAKNKLEFKRFYKQSRFTIKKNNTCV